MKREYQKKKFLVKGKAIYIGIDVHKEKWHITARADGEEIFHGCRRPSEYECLKKFLDRFKGCEIKVAYEAGPCGFRTLLK
jgi:hypothetical protein